MQDPKNRPTAITVVSQLQSSCPLQTAADVALPPNDALGIGRSDSGPPQKPLDNRAWHALAQHEELDVDGLAQSALDSLAALKRWYTIEQCV